MAEDINLYELFELEEPKEAEGAKDAETAEPQEAEEVEEGAKDEEVAEPQENVGGEEAEEAEEEEDVNAKFGNIRRKAEADAQAKLEKILKDSGLTDADGNAIETVSALEAYKTAKAQTETRQKDSELREALEYSGLSEEEVERLIRGQNALDELDALKAQIKQAEFTARMNNELSIIGEFEPEVKGLQDLNKLPHYDEFVKLIDDNAQRGINTSFLEAYMLTHRDRLHRSSLPERNEPASKAHLTSTKSKSGATADLPDDVYQTYKMFNPGVSRAEAARHYNRQKG